MVEASDLPREETFLSSNILTSLDTSTSVMDSFFSHACPGYANSAVRPTPMSAPRVATHAPFDSGVYKTVSFEYLMLNDLHSAHVESHDLKVVRPYARIYVTSLANLSHASMRLNL
ncbi:hypothetical protein JCM33374_g6307 [Metschnikowia sp. JCM 33374]|nr:hypothetical protein JCM33374_g6307 [Metschnikowia sp. JCM 33374]